ncbi:MAG: hypothetical protein AB8B79_13955 [Granulosicoccus sp.]
MEFKSGFYLAVNSDAAQSSLNAAEHHGNTGGLLYPTVNVF